MDYMRKVLRPMYVRTVPVRKRRGRGTDREDLRMIRPAASRARGVVASDEADEANTKACSPHMSPV